MRLALAIVLAATPFIAFAQKGAKTLLTRDTIDCILSTGATISFDGNQDGKFGAEIFKEKLIITITNLSSKDPLLVGNGGTSPLRRIGSGSPMYLLEVTTGGNLNVWTYFPDAGFLTMTKQYGLSGPFAMLMGGKCELR